MTQLRLWPRVSEFCAGWASSRKHRRETCRLGIEPLETRTVLSASGLSPLFDAPRHEPDRGPNHAPPPIHLAAPVDRDGGPARGAGQLLLAPSNSVSSAPAHRAYFATPILASYIGTRSLGGITFDRSEPSAPANPVGNSELPVRPSDTGDSLVASLDVRNTQSSSATSSTSAAVEADLLGDRLTSAVPREGSSLGLLESSGLPTTLSINATLALANSVADTSFSYFRAESIRDTSSSLRETLDSKGRLSAVYLQSTPGHNDFTSGEHVSASDEASPTGSDTKTEETGGLIELESDLSSWRQGIGAGDEAAADDADAETRVATSKRAMPRGGAAMHQTRRLHVEQDTASASTADLALRDVAAWQTALESVQPQEEGGMIELLAADVSRFGMGNAVDQEVMAYIGRNIELEAGIQLYQAFELFASADDQLSVEAAVANPVASSAPPTDASNPPPDQADASSGSTLSQAIVPAFLALGALVWARPTRAKKRALVDESEPVPE